MWCNVVARSDRRYDSPLWGGSLMGKTVIVADDEEFIVDLLATLLEDEGYTVVRAYDGEQALRAARQHAIDLIITDNMMPKMSGTEMARRLRADNESAKPPIIVMSAVLPSNRVNGATFLPKPFDLDRVLELVSSLVP